MRRLGRLLALLPALALLTGALAGSADANTGPKSAAVTRVTVSVHGLDRNGAVVKALRAVFLSSQSGAFYESYHGESVRLPRGGYLVGASVPTGNSSETLVVRHVIIRRSGVVTMNAEHGKLVRVALTGVTATSGKQAISACLFNSGNTVVHADAYGGNGVRIYAVPFRSPNVSFSYQKSWQDASGVSYDLTGSSHGGIPTGLSFSQAKSGLAKLTVAVRDGVNPATSIEYQLSPGNYFLSNCGYNDVDVQTTEPFSTTQYVSPGLWTTVVYTMYGNDVTGFNLVNRRLAARQRYSQTYGAAVAGPGTNFPTMTGNIFRYEATDLFKLPATPLGDDDQCCARSHLTLKVGNHLVADVQRTEWRGPTWFRKTLTRAGWYTFNISARRFNPHGTEPPNLLSNRATLSWRFHLTPVPPAGIVREPPITVTSYEPRGLSADNLAAAGATTTVAFQIHRAGQQGTPASRYAFKSIRVLASFNGGKTWQTLKISRHGSGWLTSVPDPLTGYVALRSIVTDVHGDRTVQTIYRAYSVN